jgi:hypothetical protein
MKNKPHIPKTWKNFELKVAKDLGGERNPLSGRSSKHCYGDVIHSHFTVEVKYNEFLPLARLFEEVRAEAKKVGKIPLIAFKAKGQRGYLYVTDSKSFLDMLILLPLIPYDIGKGE